MCWKTWFYGSKYFKCLKTGNFLKNTINIINCSKTLDYILDQFIWFNSSLLDCNVENIIVLLYSVSYLMILLSSFFKTKLILIQKFVVQLFKSPTLISKCKTNSLLKVLEWDANNIKKLNSAKEEINCIWYLISYMNWLS